MTNTNNIESLSAFLVDFQKEQLDYELEKATLENTKHGWLEYLLRYLSLKTLVS